MSRQDKLQYEFLPDALEIIETPPSPLGKVVIWGIVGILVFALLWASLGTVDVIAIARGKVIPDGAVKVVQSNEGGKIAAIKVKEGQKVTKGQELILLDTTIKNTDLKSISRDYAIAVLELDLLKYGQASDKTKQTLADAGITEETQSDVQGSVWAKSTSFSSKEQSMTQILNQANAQLNIEEDTLRRLEESLSSHPDGSPAKTAIQSQVDAQKSRVEQARSAVTQAKSGLSSAQNDNSTTLSGLIVEQDKKVSNLVSQLEKAKVGVEQQTLVSPVDGMVSSLTVHTVGAAAAPAQTLLTVVPTETPLIVNASIENKDIGYVTVGQDAALKFDAFSFQQYGVVPGKIIAISPDSADNKDGTASLYKANLTFDKKIMKINSRDVPIMPGMTVTVEIKTGTRRIIQFFFDPLIKNADESLKVR